MSSYLLPVLPGQAMEVEREEIYSNKVFTALSGRETRTIWQTYPRYRFNVRWNFLRSQQSELQNLVAMLSMHRGAADSFLLSAPDDNAVVAHGFAVGDGATTTHQLQHTIGGNRSDALGSWPVYTTPRTNSALYSQAPSNAAWTKRASHSVVTASESVAPDGSGLSDYAAAAGGVANTGIYQDIAGTNGAWYCSAWVKLRASLTQVSICVKERATDTVRASTTVTLGAGWQRIGITGTTSTGGGVRIEVAGIGTGSFWLWGLQAEYPNATTTATRLIKTAAAAVKETPAYWPAMGDGFEPITDPDYSSVQIYKDGVLQTPSSANWSPGTAGTIVWLGGSTPASGAVLTWTGSYWRRMRFVQDSLTVKRIFDKIYSAEAEFLTVK
jgi:hypothetical protein